MAPCVQYYTTINKILINLRPGLRYHQAGSRHINIIIYTFFTQSTSSTFSFCFLCFLFAYFCNFNDCLIKLFITLKYLWWGQCRPQRTGSRFPRSREHQRHRAGIQRHFIQLLLFNRDKHFFDRIFNFFLQIISLKT